MSTKKVVLSKPSDWDAWIYYVRTRATNSRVWSLVNPDLTTRPASLDESEEPGIDIPADGILPDGTLDLYKLRKEQYKTQLAKFERQQKAFADLITFTQETIAAHNAVFIQKVEPHPWDLLRALKKRFAPSDDARCLDIEQRYHKLKKGPGSQDLEKWLDEWVTVYTQATDYKIGEVSAGRPIRDFLLAIRGNEPSYSDTKRAHLPKDTDMLDLVEDFRQYIRVNETLKASNPTQSAFAIESPSIRTNSNSNQTSNHGNNSSLRGNRQDPPTCLCGTTHWYADCYYLNQDRRPTGWTPRQDTQQKVDQALQNQKTRAAVERARWKRKNRDNNDGTNNQAQSSNSNISAPLADTNTVQDSNGNRASVNRPSAFSIQSIVRRTPTAFVAMSMTAAQNASLRSYFILDSGADGHVINSSMLHMFTMNKHASSNDCLQAGNQHLPIDCYGTVTLPVDSHDGPFSITLLNVAYVPDFMTNIVSLHKFVEQGVHFDTEKMHLHINGETYCKVYPKAGHFTFNSRPLLPASTRSAFFAATKSRSSLEWHKVLAHASHDTVMHLEESTSGIKIDNKESAQVPRTNECETCALTKSQRIVSRSPDVSEDSDKPFYRITFDLLHHDPALNGDQWTTHIACRSTDFNLVFTHSNKSDAPKIILDAIALIETRYNGKVVFFRSDGERTLGTDFLNQLKAKGITIEPSAPDTPDQNGHSERKGGVIAMKARALRIEAGLPPKLWNEAIRAAGYIANRTPMKKHGWKTPYELVTGKQPNLKHLRLFGCKAYAHIKHIPRKQKLAERAHIGFLVGYDSTNIFRIWIPLKRKIIRTRDILFDENSSYDPSEPDLLQLIEEPMLEATFDIPPLNSDTLITEIESDDEEFLDTHDYQSQQQQVVSNLEQEQHTVTKHVDESDADVASNRQLPTPIQTATPELISLAHSGPTEDNSSSGGESTPIYDTIEVLMPAPAISEHSESDNDLETPTQSPAPAPKDISSRLDAQNILPEGVKRSSTRRQAYSAALQTAAIQGNTTTFHTAFSSMLQSKKYYETELKSIIATNNAMLTTQASTRLHRDNLPPEPQNYKEMLRHPHAEGFKQALSIEVETLQAKGTWREVPFSDAKATGKTPIPTTWVFKYKFDDQGYLTKYKARLCARGDLQHTEQDTFAATLAARIFRALMALMAAFDYESRQYDAINAFANSPIDEPTYCKPPEGWTGDRYILFLLLRALYGLKQSPALWYKHLSQTLHELGLEQVPGVECLFVNEYMIVFFFVDDIAIIFDRHYTNKVDEIQAKLFQIYEMRYLGEVEWFLGIRIIRDRPTRRLWLSQDSYIDKLSAKFNVTNDGKFPSTPLPFEELIKSTDQATAQEIYAYQQRVGSVNFAAVISRPDIAHAASKLSEHLTNPSRHHMDCANRVLRYLVGTKSLSIEFNCYVSNPRSVFLASSDASYANDPDTRRSSQGYVFLLYNGTIDWSATKQKTVTCSTTEAELLAISTTAKETMWWNRFFDSINFTPGHSISIQCDNQQTIRALTADTPRLTTKLRHVDIHQHWLRQEIQQRTISVHWVPTARILADGFTKSLPSQKHKEFIQLLGLVNHNSQ